MSSRQNNRLGNRLATSAHRDRLVDTLRPAVSSAGLDLEDIEVTPAGRRRLVRVVVDKDGGVTLDDIAATTRVVSQRLDEDDDVMGDTAYTLEVTSPGTDRPLTEQRHWRRNVGRLVKVTPHEGEPVTGRITGAGETAAVLDVDGSSRDVAYADVRKARIEVEFNRKED
ncbi:MAG TPA: ribosome maturation factor RimP [Nocardioidaceae bacterium]|nr:ribosome maturation factor RimP [Nocardioidaceae bacterium]